MLIWLIDRFAAAPDSLAPGMSGPSPVFLTARIGLAAVVSFLAAIRLGPRCIAWLRVRFSERIDSASTRLNELHAAKAGTPSMGGVFIAAAIVISVLMFVRVRPTSPSLP